MRERLVVWKEKIKKQSNFFKEEWNQLLMQEDGMGVVEVILIIVVLISLVIIFKKQITSVVKNIMSSIEKDSKSVYGS